MAARASGCRGSRNSTAGEAASSGDEELRHRVGGWTDTE